MTQLVGRSGGLINRVQAQLSALRENGVSPKVAWLLIKVIGAGFALYVLAFERSLAKMFVAGSTTLLIGAILLTVTRRPMFSAVATAGLVGLILSASLIKRYFIKMILHGYDIVFYFGNLDTLRFFWEAMASYLVLLAVVLVVLGAIGRLVFKADPLRVGRQAAIRAVAGLAVLTAGSVAVGSREVVNIVYKNEDFLSTFYLSWVEVADAVARGQMIAAAPPGSAPLLPVPATCKPGEKPPHIVLIHQESILPPHYFPELSYDRSLDPFYRSYDGSTRKLAVEVYGGGSWLTEFSVMAGTSTYEFGGLRQFVMTSMNGRLADTLPQALDRCGYRNVFYNPMRDGFMATGAFYRSIGMHETYDQVSQGASYFHGRDSLYYGNALKRLETHLASSSDPMFVFLMTIVAHMPYDFTFEPEQGAVGGGPGTTPAMHEYLRRSAMAKQDYEAFVAELARRFPDERFLIVQYGDHHPIATEPLVGIKMEGAFFGAELEPDSLIYRTFYAVNTINFPPPPMPEVDSLDVAYLGSYVMQAAGLPLPPSHAERLRLMEVCNGRYYRCADRNEILRFQRSMIDSGLMKVR